MSCSARIPIYVLLVGAFFPAHGSLIFLGLYLLGIIVAVATAWMLRRFGSKRRDAFRHGAASLPHTYRKSHDAQIRAKAKQYLRKWGTDSRGIHNHPYFSYFPQRTPEDVPAEYLTEALTEMQAVDSIKTDSNDAIALATKRIPTGEIHTRRNRPSLRTRGSSARIRLENKRIASCRSRSQGSGRLYTRSPLRRRR